MGLKSRRRILITFKVEMLSTEVVIGICVAVSVCFLFTGSMFAVWLLRYRDQKRTQAALTRGLSTYHRAHLSIDGSNYYHIQRPRAPLRRSGQLPYGVVSEVWRETPSQENLRPHQITSTQELPESDKMVPHSKRRKNLRQTLYGHALNIPKTRRQKKFEMAIAQNSIALSPLSAITEFTDPPEERTADIAELPTIITPRQMAEKLAHDGPLSRPVSIQWPLPLASRRSKDKRITVITSIPVRDSILIRKGSLDTTIHGDRPTMGRSLSITSNFSVAPEESLRPLPLRAEKYSQENKSDSRRSNVSMDTISSSVLGSIHLSPQTAYNLTTPTVDFSSPSLHQFSPARTRGDLPAITMGTAACKRAQQGTMSGTSGRYSFRASIGEHAGRKSLSNSTTIDYTDQRFNNSHFFDTSLKTIDASNWNSDQPSRSVFHDSTLSSSLPTPIARRTYRDLNASAHYSMFESQLSVGKRASNPIKSSAANILTESPGQLAPPRPASVASGSPYQWYLRPPSVFSLSPLPTKKGHKRQSCVRISNLPAVDPKRNGKLPEMMEEYEEDLGSPEASPKIPGLASLELELGTPALRVRASLVSTRASSSPSPFKNRPILKPTAKKRSYRPPSQGVPRPDSDIFISDPKTPTPLDGRDLDSRNWPLSPTPRNNIKLNSTPSPLTSIVEPEDHESPTLPSPALTSATLFPRKSAVQGPRNQAVSGTSSRNVSPSPLNVKVGQRGTGDELRRSVMMLRRQTSEGKLLDPASRLYRNMGEQSTCNFSLPNVSQSNYSLSTRISASMSPSDKRRGSNMALNGASASRTKLSMAFSPSMISMSGASVWEDDSVCDEMDLEMRNSMMRINEQTSIGGCDPEAYEDVFGRQQYIERAASSCRDMQREGSLTSLPGKGLGIHWGTPGSLYDGDGFLKDRS